ncbi:S8 family serine peptidase [Myxococcus sp. SDU36]|uniref:S8 family peptidase n=1 Tax=Myxococcus sp. SDU36 TaxID=2831967 RepID=UPI0025436AFD|nr:S8 family serine peptidase [Myxococcus sp. SDU36]WIG95944.1 S8 family serine peptidase [Myxococcus sp. SDU36]
MRLAARIPLLSTLLTSLLLSACGSESPEPSHPVTGGALTQLAATPAPLERPETRRRFAPGQAIVKLKDSAKARASATVPSVRGYQTALIEPLPGGASLVSLVREQPLARASVAEEEASTLAAIEALRQDPDVEYAHENLYFELFATPTDPLYSLQWNYPAMNLPQAWNTVTGNVTIAVLDTGRLDHPDLLGRWTTGYDFGDGDADPYATGTYHHGIHVAGILAARPNNGVGGAGICWGCQLMPLKVSASNGGILMTGVNAAIRHAADNGARVINMSFGAGYNPNAPSTLHPCSNYPDMQSAVNYALSKGVVLVAAAGNHGAANYQTANVTPASCNGVIAVGASTQSGGVANWSNKGSRVDVIAPGGLASASLYGQGIGCLPDSTMDPYVSGTDQIVSAWATGKPSSALTPGDYCYRYLSGTSMSAPHVAGLAALMLSQKPSLTPAQVTARIKQTATPVSGCAGHCGTGRVNAAAAIYTHLPSRPTQGLWWNPARSGNAIDLQHVAADQLYVTWFTYTSAGTPIWYISSLHAEPGEWRGDLVRTSWNGASATTSVVGTARLILSGGQWHFYWMLGGFTGSEPIQPFVFASGAPAMNLTGVWYNPLQSGWGVTFASQGTLHVANVTVYQGSNPVWLQGVVNSSGTSLSFPMSYITGYNLCPGCSGTPSVNSTPAGTFTIHGAAGIPSAVPSSLSVSFPGGTWNRPSFSLQRLTGP